MSRVVPRPRGFAISWYFVPDVGSAALDFFKRLKGCDADFVVTQVASGRRDPRLLELPTRAGFERLETTVDATRPRDPTTRQRFVDEVVAAFTARAGTFDFLLSHSNEVVSHAAARACKRLAPHLPWIAYFGDVVSANPYIKYIPDLPGFAEDCATEAACLREADIVICNNDYQRRLMFSGDFAPFADKAVVIPHCYDPSLYGPDVRPGGRFVLRHLGALYEVKRRAQPVLEAVDFLLQEDPERTGRFELVFHGDGLYPADQAAWRRMAHGDHVRVEGPVGYLESLRLMSDSDALLLIDGVFDEAHDGLAFSPYFPGKLADYMGARRPILAVTMPRGPSAELLAPARAEVCGDDPAAIARSLRRLLDGEVVTDFVPFAAFDIAAVTQAFEATLRRALARLADGRDPP